MKQREQNRELILKIVAIILAAMMLLSIALLLIHFWGPTLDEAFSGDSDPESSVVYIDGDAYRLRDGLETILLMGLDVFESADSAGYRNNQQADFLMLLVIDHTNRSYSVIHVDRDTIVQMNVLGVAGESIGTVEQQLALAHTYGNGRQVSCRNTADAVSTVLLDAPIDQYVSVTMDAVSKINDSIGGVELTVLDDFSAVDPTLVKGETVTLTGKQALTYVRARSGMEDATNRGRMTRQRQYVEALIHTIDAASQQDDQLFTKLFADLSDSESEAMISNCTSMHLQTTFEKLLDYSFESIHSIEGESRVTDGWMAFYPNEESVKQVVVDLIYVKE